MCLREDIIDKISLWSEFLQLLLMLSHIFSPQRDVLWGFSETGFHRVVQDVIILEVIIFLQNLIFLLLFSELTKVFSIIEFKIHAFAPASV